MIRKWFDIWWYKYLFERPSAYYNDVGWLRTIWCRLRNHPDGPIYYTGPTATEPDMHCKNCGDEL